MATLTKRSTQKVSAKLFIKNVALCTGINLLYRGQRQAAVAFAGEFRQSIDYRRRDYRNRRFTASRGLFRVGHDVDIYRNWRILYVGWSVAVEVALLHAAILQCDRSLGHQLRDSETEAPLHLALDGERIHGDSRIDRNGDAMNPGALILYRDFHRASHSGFEALMTRDSDSVIAWNAHAPRSALLFQEGQARAKLLCIGREEFQAIGNGIHFRACCQLVHERFHDEAVMRVANRAPPQYRDVDLGMMRRNMEVRYVVVSICGAFHCCFIHAILNQQRSKWRSRDERLTHNYMPPRCRHAIVTNANLDTMDMHGAIVTALDIILPRPNKLDRLAAKTSSDRRRLPLHMRIGNSAP